MGLSDRRPRVSRRVVLATGGVLALGAGGVGLWESRRASTDNGKVSPHGPQVHRREAARRSSGRTVTVELVPAAGHVDLAGKPVSTLLYGGSLPGQPVRLRAGDTLHARLVNRLTEPTTVHWHGLRIRNDMDGVPGLTTTATPPGATFDYRFVAPDPGTYFLHSHVGMQRERGLSAPLVVEDPHEPGDHDADVTLLLDDWTDGLGPSPDALLDRLRRGLLTGPTEPAVDESSPWGPMLGDVRYPAYLVNGRPPADPFVISARPRARIRLRIINAAGDTAFRVALGGHRLTVTHADAWPVRPVTVDTLLVGMGERYDVVVTAGDGVFPLVASAEGKQATAMAVLRTGAGRTPPPTVQPRELTRRMLGYSDLRPVAAARLPDRPADRTIRLLLRSFPPGFHWAVSGRPWPNATPLPVRVGQRLRLELTNASAMTHPIHLHGHTFALAGTGTRKDTVAVLPGKTQAIDVQADNPGQWLLHCHNAYHLAAGMATVLSYRR